MDENAEKPRMWIASAQRIEDAQLREQVTQAAESTWDRALAYATFKLGEPEEAGALLDGAVNATLAAHRKKPVRDVKSYLFSAIASRAARLARRNRKIEYLSPDQLTGIRETVDTGWVERLDTKLQVEELIGMMDDTMRIIYALKSRGLSVKEIAAFVGMTEKNVYASYERGIERLRRRLMHNPQTGSSTR